MDYSKAQWKAQSIDGDWEVVSPEFQIAHVCNYGIAKKLDIAPANARLIAAAPEMYEALKQITKIASGVMVLDDTSSTFQVIKAALAKAEGGEERFEPVVGPDPRD